MSASDLRELKKGHSVVRRAMKRTDLEGNDIRPRPIYNCAEDGTKLKFSYDPIFDSYKVKKWLQPQ